MNKTKAMQMNSVMMNGMNDMMMCRMSMCKKTECFFICMDCEQGL